MQIRPNWSGILGPMFYLAIALIAAAVVTTPGTIPTVSAPHTPVAVPSPDRTTVRVQTSTAMAQTVGPEGGDPVPTNGTATVQITHLSLFAAASVTDPHGGYSDSTDLCQSCHAVHGASSPTHLLVQPDRKSVV